MEQFYSFLALPLAIVAACLVNILINRRLSKAVALILVSVSIILVSPLLFTDYTYSDSFDGFYSSLWIYSFIIGILTFLALNLLRINKILKWSVLILIFLVLTAFALLGIFARGFVGDDKIYAAQRTKEYKVIYRREAEAVLTGATRVDLYRTRFFGLLQKQIDLQYLGDGSCVDTLFDKDRSKQIMYNHCENKISVK